MTEKPRLNEILLSGRRVPALRPWPRAVIDEPTWRLLGEQLAEGVWTLLALWGEPEAVHMALLDEGTPAIAVFTLACPERRFPSVRRVHPAAIRLERSIRDLYGLEPEDAPTGGPGWIMAVGGSGAARARAMPSRLHRRPMTSSRRKARACIGFPSVPFTPASSSRGISVSRRMARPWCASKSASAIPTRASSP